MVSLSEKARLGLQTWLYARLAQGWCQLLLETALLVLVLTPFVREHIQGLWWAIAASIVSFVMLRQVISLIDDLAAVYTLKTQAHLRLEKQVWSRAQRLIAPWGWKTLTTNDQVQAVQVARRRFVVGDKVRHLGLDIPGVAGLTRELIILGAAQTMLLCMIAITLLAQARWPVLIDHPLIVIDSRMVLHAVLAVSSFALVLVWGRKRERLRWLLVESERLTVNGKLT